MPRGAGAFLILFAAAVWLVSSRPTRIGVGAVIAANALWVVDSIALLAFGWHEPTTAGAVWVALQALTVAAFAGLQGYAASSGARRASAVA